MATGKSTWKRNKLLTARRNYFNLGGAIAQGVGTLAQGIGSMVNSISAEDVKARKKELLAQANNAQMKGQSANDSFDSLAHDMATTAQLKKVDKYDLGAKGVGSMITESLVGGGTGAMAGYTVGNAIPSGSKATANEGGDIVDSPIDGSEMGNLGIDTPMMAAYGGPLVHKYMGGGAIGAIGGGILGAGMSIVGNLIRNHKAKKAAQEVNKQIEYTNDFNDRSMMNRALNLGSSQLAALEQNYAAFGGPLDFGSPIIDYDFMDRYIRTKELSSQGQADRLASMPYAFGGELNTQGLDFTNGLLQINEGGSHEANPYEGVLIGIDQEGAPNLVEEGETIYNDYVFSNRLTVPKAIREKYKLRSTKPMSFAEASKKLAKESEERPNDPISQRGLDTMLQDLAIAQEEKRARKEANKLSRGGKVNRFDEGGYYDMSPFMNALSGYSYSKKPGGTSGKYAIDNNLFGGNNPYMLGYSDIGGLEGSKEYQNFTNTVMDNPDNYMDYLHALDAGTAPGVTKLFNGDALVDNWRDLYKARRTDSKGGIYHWTPIWQEATTGGTPVAAGADGNPVTDTTEATTPIGNVTPSATDRYYIKGANGYELVEGDNPLKYIMDQGNFDEVRRAKNDLNGQDFYYDPRMEVDLGRNKLEWLRYAPAVGFGLSAITDAIGLTNKPDYSNADLIMSSTRNAYTPQVGFRPIGNYLAYNPLDREFYINQMNAQAGATRRAIAQNAGLNRGAGLAAILAADNNAQNQLGLLARQAEEYNLGQRQLTERFNRETNMFNSEGFLKADIANQQAAMSGRDFALRGTIAAAQMRADEKARADAARSANLSGLFQTLGDIGYEAKNDNMVRRLIETGALGPGAQRAYMDSKEKSARQKAEKAAEKEARRVQKQADKDKRNADKRAAKIIDNMVLPGLFEEEQRRNLLDRYIGQDGGRPIFSAAYGGKLKSRRRKGLTI